MNEINQPDEPGKRAQELGHRLRDVRAKTGESLRSIERRSSLNSGYLSQLENGKIVHPSPTILQKVARGYGLRFEDLLRWSGYVAEESTTTPNQAVALSTVAELGDPSDEELATLRAIVGVLKSKRSATFSPPSDLALDQMAIGEIRARAVAILREADGLGRRPTPLQDVQAAARLVDAGELTLDVRDRARLVERFGDWVQVALRRLRGAVDFRSSAIWLAPDMHAMRRRFVVSHEIGHAILPAHRETFAYIEDFTCLPPIARRLYEREANQAAVEILFQGGQATEVFDSSRPSLDGLCKLASEFGASIVASARYAVETSQRQVALAIAHRGQAGYLGPTHIYSSSTFESAFGWRSGAAPYAKVRLALQTASIAAPHTVTINDLRREAHIANVETMDTGYAAIALVIPEPRTLLTARRLASGRSLILGRRQERRARPTRV